MLAQLSRDILLVSCRNYLVCYLYFEFALCCFFSTEHKLKSNQWLKYQARHWHWDLFVAGWMLCLGEWRVIISASSNGISWTWPAFLYQMFMLQNNEHGRQWLRTCHSEPGESSGVVHTSLRFYDLCQMPLWHQRHRRVFRTFFLGRGRLGANITNTRESICLTRWPGTKRSSNLRLLNWRKQCKLMFLRGDCRELSFTGSS